MRTQQENLIHERLNSIQAQQNDTHNSLVQLRNAVADITATLQMVVEPTRALYTHNTVEHSIGLMHTSASSVKTQLPTTRILLVVGHNPIVKGAYSPHLSQSEYDFNLQLARSLEGSMHVTTPDNGAQLSFETHIVYRNGNTSRRELLMNKIVPMAGETAFDLIVELHFNSFSDPSATGKEILHASTSAIDRKLGETLLNTLNNHMPIRNRGVKQLTPNDRGYSNVTMSWPYVDAPYFLLEPFFGSNPTDCNMARSNLHSAMTEALTAVAISIATEKVA